MKLLKTEFQQHINNMHPIKVKDIVISAHGFYFPSLNEIHTWLNVEIDGFENMMQVGCKGEFNLGTNAFPILQDCIKVVEALKPLLLVELCSLFAKHNLAVQDENIIDIFEAEYDRIELADEMLTTLENPSHVEQDLTK